MLKEEKFSKIEFIDLISNFYETVNFPKDVCKIKNPNEAGVFDSDVKFECVTFNKKYPGEHRILQCTPYAAKDNIKENESYGKILFGWASINFDSWIDHFENNIHDDDEVVIAWRRIDSLESRKD